MQLSASANTGAPGAPPKVGAPAPTRPALESVVVAAEAIPLLRVPPGALIRVGTHGVVVGDSGASLMVRFDTGHLLAVDAGQVERF